LWVYGGLVLFCLVAVLPVSSQANSPDQLIDGGDTGDTTTSRPPNILFIMTDQQHAGMMSCAGNPDLKTPAMDSLARDGIRFTNAYAANPVCVPSRIAMATGVMPGRLGVFNNGMKADVPHDVDAHSLGKLIKSAGYDTFYGGKVHMCAQLAPLNAGYDEYFKDQRDELPAACVEFIERKREKPFFVVASFINPHDICFAYSAYKGKSPKGKQSVEHLYRQAAALPLDELPPLPDNYVIPPEEPHAIESNLSPRAVTPAGTMRTGYDEREWRIYRWIYCRLTEQVDRHIGQILDAVQRSGLEDETLIVFTSDHGNMDASHRLASKGLFYEESAGVPLLMKYKGAIPPGTVDEHLVSNGLDILPTLCDYAGVAVPKTLLGKSLRSIADGNRVDSWRSYVVSENHTGRMIRSQRYKYCVYAEGTMRESLVDMRNDPGEMKNLVSLPEYKDALLEHQSYLDRWIEESGDTQARTFAVEAARE
jgi:arylsulfatase A-like enzyme